MDKLRGLNLTIAENLKKSEVISRPGAGNGLCLLAVIPLLMLVSCFRYKVSIFYLSATALSTGLLVDSVILVVFLSKSGRKLNEESYTNTLVSGFIAIIVLFFFKAGNFLSVVSCILFIKLYSLGLWCILMRLPQCFTFGEGAVVMQAVTLFAYSTVLKIHYYSSNALEKDWDISYFISQAGLLTVALILVQSYWTRNNFKIFAAVNGTFVITLFLFLHAMLGKSSILWIFIFIADGRRLMLISSWLIFFVFAGATVRHHTQSRVKASTSTRKVFHVLVVAVYLPGLLADIGLMVVASAVALSLLLLLEMFRKTEVVRFSEFLNQAFSIYCDEKDIGGFSLTPIYLLVGVSCPLALVPDAEDPQRRLALLSGVLSIGIGDSVASWFGSRYGKIKWRDTGRTVEGTLSNIVSQFATVCLLYISGFLEGDRLLYKGVAVSAVSGLTEAFTDQVDNLILPIVTLLVLAVL